MLAERLIRRASREADSSQLTADNPKKQRESEVVTLQNNGSQKQSSKAGQAPPLQNKTYIEPIWHSVALRSFLRTR
jgi:ribose 1,5-bisphosphokinase PhnN